MMCDLSCLMTHKDSQSCLWTIVDEDVEGVPALRVDIAVLVY